MSGIDAVDCPSASDCFASADISDTSPPVAALATTNGGTSWTTQAMPGDANGIGGVACPSTTECFIAGHTNSGGFVAATTDAGATWVTQSVPSDGWDIDGVTCISASNCIVAGGTIGPSVTGVIDETSDGGSTWTSNVLASGSSTLTAAACPLLGPCFAVGFAAGGGSAGSGIILKNVAPPAPSITTTSLPSGTIGSSYAASLAATGGSSPYTWSIASGALPAGLALDPSTGAITGTPSAPGSPSATFEVTDANGSTAEVTLAVAIYPVPGYWLVGSDGGIFSFGSAVFHGSTGSLKLNRPVVGITPTADKNGYWLVASDGGIFAFQAPFVGSIPGLGINPYGSGLPHSLDAPIAGMVPAVSGRGYFMVASDGGVFAFNAPFEGSCYSIGGCSGPAVAVVPDATGNGYWVVTATGHVYAFGDAPNYGSPGQQGTPITSAVATPDGRGYWIMDGAGQIFNYGDASYLGGLAAGSTNGLDPAQAVFADSDGHGYWIATAAGKVTQFGDAPFDGDMSGTRLNGPVIAATGF